MILTNLTVINRRDTFENKLKFIKNESTCTTLEKDLYECFQQVYFDNVLKPFNLRNFPQRRYYPI